MELISRVKGEQRRRWLKELLEAAESEEASDFLVKEELSDEDLRALGRCHPQFMGGEYLPSLKREEIEIARVSLNSTLGDVISIRARRRGETIHYKIFDDYYSDGHRWVYPTIKGVKLRTQDRIILRALEKDRELRYQTASDLRAEILKYDWEPDHPPELGIPLRT